MNTLQNSKDKFNKSFSPPKIKMSPETLAAYNKVRAMQDVKYDLNWINNFSNIIIFMLTIAKGTEIATKRCLQTPPDADVLSCPKLIGSQVGGAVSQLSMANVVSQDSQKAPILIQRAIDKIREIINDPGKIKELTDSFLNPEVGDATTASLNFISLLMYRLSTTATVTTLESLFGPENLSPEKAREEFKRVSDNQAAIMNAISEDPEAMEALRELVTAYSVLALQFIATTRPAFDIMLDEISDAMVRTFGKSVTTAIAIARSGAVAVAGSVPFYGAAVVWANALEKGFDQAMKSLSPGFKAVGAADAVSRDLDAKLQKFEAQKNAVTDSTGQFINKVQDIKNNVENVKNSANIPTVKAVAPKKKAKKGKKTKKGGKLEKDNFNDRINKISRRTDRSIQRFLTKRKTRRH